MTTERNSRQPRIPISSWCTSDGKRCLDAVAAIVALLILSPLLIVIALAILISSGHPILFRQRRVGRLDSEFELFKFRTMTNSGSEDATGLTQRGNSRVTLLGHLLRRYKLDELPQLWNVFRGEMTLVGPRPDMKKFWDAANEADRQVLFLTPGLTGTASIAFCDEESLLAKVPTDQLTSFYVDEVIPVKAEMDMEYASHATIWTDCRILLQTLCMPLLKDKKAEKGNYAPVSRQ
jgi:lipopolysaccharide/colanic/teichoic acid biosynthesis glycosyltransferase